MHTDVEVDANVYKVRYTKISDNNNYNDYHYLYTMDYFLFTWSFWFKYQCHDILMWL